MLIGAVALIAMLGAVLAGARQAPATPSNVSGTVHAPGGAAVANVGIQVWTGGANQQWVTWASTNGSGVYSVDLDDGQYLLKFTPPAGQPYGSTQRTITVAGSPLTGQDVTLPAANVTGHVQQPDGSALPASTNGTVDVRDAAGHYINNGPSGASFLDDGAYALTLPAGSYVLHAYAYGNSSFTASDTPITVPASGSQTLDLRLTSPNVTGHVYAPDGTTPEQTYIDVQTSTGGYSGIDGVSSASDGSYALHLPSGTWLLHAQAVSPYAAGSATVTVGGSPQTRDISLRNPDLAVHVTSPDGSTPIQGSWVSVQQGSSWIGGASTDAGGLVRFDLPSGSYTVSAGAGASSYFASSPTNASVTAGSLHTVEVHLRQPNVSGHVQTSGGSPVANSSVTIYSGSSQNGPWVANVETDGAGNFTLALDDGSYTAVATAPPGTPVGQGAPMTFGVSGTTTVPAIVLPAANVSGTIFRPDGHTPIANANIAVHTSDWSVNAYTSSGSDGAFYFHLAPGDYVAAVDPPWGTTGMSSAQGAFTVADTSVSGLTFSLTVPNVHGILTTPSTDALGHPVTPTPVGYASVSVHNDDYTYSVNTTTDTDGTFSVYLPSSGGPFTFTAWAPDGADYDSPVPLTVEGPTGSTITLRYTSQNVSGYAYFGAVSAPPDPTSAAPTAANNVWVTIHNDDWTFYRSAHTDGFGKFRAGLPAGTYVAQAQGGDSGFTNSPSVTITVAADGTVTPSPINLVLGNPELRGKVVDSAGNGVAYSFVSVHTANYSEYSYASTGSDGTFVVGGLPAGAGYVADAEPGWGTNGLLRTEVSGITIPADQTTWPVTISNNADGKLHLSVAQDTIHVSIRRPDGSAITSGASVNGYQSSGGYAYASSPTAGTYDLKVDDGTWNVGVWPSGNADWVYTGASKIAVTDASHRNVNVTLTVTNATAQVSGRVVDPSGNPVHAYGAWVYVSTPNGIGNGGSVASNGTFTVHVPPGSYNVTAYPSSPNYGAPAPMPVSVNDGQTLNVGDVQLLQRNSEIRGTVAFAGGTAVSGAAVFAYQPDGGGYAEATTASDGKYSLKVTAGKWEIGIWPQPGDSWVYLGSPLEVTIGANALVTGQDFAPQPVAGTIHGVVLDPSGATAEVDGWVTAQSSAGETGAPLFGGTFSIPAVAGTYTVQLSLSPGTPYLSTTSAAVTVAADGTVSPANVTLTLAALDDTISGHLVNQTGGSVTASNVTVSAVDANGNYESAQVASDGSYSLAVGVGTWQVGTDVRDPGLTGIALGDGHGGLASSRVTFSVSGQSQTRDVIVAVADQHLTGSIKTSSGVGVPYAWVSVDSPPNATTPVHTGALANDLGHFDLLLPAGTYLVSASANLAGEDAPPVTTVSVSGGSQSVSPLTLSFRAHTATISGHVDAPVSGLTINVNAWSDKGGIAKSTADASGDYALAVAGDDTWHIDAGALSGSTAYVTSGGTAVTLGASGSATASTLTLAAQTVPPALTVLFDATQPKALHFGNVDLTVPAGALASAGQVRVTATALPNPIDTVAGHPIGLGYTFQAFDDAGTEIKTRFASPIRITFPYDQGQLDALGLSPGDLAPAYFDPVANAYRPASDVVIDTTNHTISFGTDHFTSFVLQTPSLAAPTVASVTPGSASSGSAHAITVTGTAFISGAAVLVGPYAATNVVVAGPTSITATVPATVPAGTYTVTVANSSGRSGSKVSALTLAAAASTGGTSSGATPPAAAQKADLAIFIDAFPAAARVGDLLTYTITVGAKNRANATGVVLHVDLPETVSLVSAYADHGQGTCTGTSRLSCALGALEGSDIATTKITVRVVKPGSLASTASITYDGESSARSASVEAKTSGSIAAPSVRVTGAATASRQGNATVVATTMRFNQPATVTIRLVTGASSRPLTLLPGSRAGATQTTRARTSITCRVPAGQAIDMKLRVRGDSLGKPAYVQVTAAGYGGSTTNTIRVRR